MCSNVPSGGTRATIQIVYLSGARTLVEETSKAMHPLMPVSISGRSCKPLTQCAFTV